MVTFKSVREANERNRGRGRRGTGVLATILDARDENLAPPESELELRLGRLLRRAGLEPEETQKELVGPDGTRIRLDCAWTSRKKGVEANGRVWHSGRQDLERNDRKARILALLGWAVMPVGYVDVVHRPDELIRDIRLFIFGE
jgi:hypothetical protein